MFGLDLGEAHVVRNAGGRACDGAIRSITVSRWLLGPREVAVVHHTDCGMRMFTDDVLRDKIREQNGVDVGATDYLTSRMLTRAFATTSGGSLGSSRSRRALSCRDTHTTSGGRVREVVPAN
jgi:carbonic anhydrase